MLNSVSQNVGSFQLHLFCRPWSAPLSSIALCDPSFLPALSAAVRRPINLFVGCRNFFGTSNSKLASTAVPILVSSRSISIPRLFFNYWSLERQHRIAESGSAGSIGIKTAPT